MGCYPIKYYIKKERSLMNLTLILFSKNSDEITRELDVEKTAKETWNTMKPTAVV